MTRTTHRLNRAAGTWRRRAAAGVTPALLGALLFAAAGMLHAQTPGRDIRGLVVNGTTNRPLAKARVNYVLMAQGPAPVATETTDAEGGFHFKNAPSSGNAPALLRVTYQGATYSHPVLPGQTPVNAKIQVFDAVHSKKAVTVKEQAIFLHPSGSILLVLEQVLIDNNSKPPKTYVNSNGTYPFSLPAKPRDGVQVTVDGPGGMPISQSPIPKGTGSSFAITYPLRPGQTQVRLQYSLDYRSPFQFSKVLDLLPEQMHIVTPGKEVQVAGDGLTPVGTDPSTGFMGFAVRPKGNLVSLQVSGEVPAEAGQQGAAGGTAAAESAALVPILNPVSTRQWVIVWAAGLVMLAGLVYLYRQS